MHTVHQVQAGLDNTFYLIGDQERRVCIVIDPFDGESALSALEQFGWRPLAVYNTHGHWDHTGGNEAIMQRFGCPVFARSEEGVPGARPLSHEADFVGVTYKVLHTPGHRPGHVCFWGEGNLFTGDTVFVAGCGNAKYGGDPGQLYLSFQRLAELPGHTRIYPGHDYAEKNLVFARTREPSNAAMAEAEAWFRRQRLAGQPHVTTLDAEKRWNPFFRLQSVEIRERLVDEGVISMGASDRETFLALRRLRDQF